MSANLDKLKRLLAELFQMDQADLDFGIYRIMNARRGEITRFLDQDLLPQVREAFQHYRSADKSVLQEELEKTIQVIRDAGMDPEQSPKVKKLREDLAKAVDVTALENEVFSDLYNFFRRYYHEGDFLSLRRYKEGVYAIPYEGEEVKLHWANHDQYYIKTMEYFRDYAFKLPSGRRVHFKIVEADTEKDNTRAQEGKERRFMLAPENPLAEEEGELVISYEYRPDPENRKQKELNEKVQEAVFQTPGLDEWLAELKQLRGTEKNPKRTVLEKHLTDYTARNTFDYFIHKDLGGFLRRELDFFIKNDIMYLDDIEHESAPRVDQYLSKIKVIRAIAHKIIDLLAQIEDFQKRLWLKKKFVMETNYCVTLDRVPEELYPEIAVNEAQREEWVRLFAIDEITGNLHIPKYSNPLTVEFLKANPFLVLDTKFFGQEFKDRLVASFEDLDSQTDGVLIHSENFQALQLLNKRYKNQVKAIYIDPPFNTGNDFLYKDNFRDSSWITLLNERIQLSLNLLHNEGNYFLHLDYNAVHYGKIIMNSIFTELNELIYNTNATKDEESGLFSYKSFGKKFVRQHDTILHGFNSSTNFIKLWKPNRNTTKLEIGQLDLISSEKKSNPKNLDDFIFYVEKYNDSDFIKVPIELHDEKIYPIGDIWNDLYSFTQSEMRTSENVSFLTQKPENLIRRIVQSSTSQGDLVLDFFAGSGTTMSVCQKLRRKFVGIEMGNHFENSYFEYDNTEGKWIEKLGILGRMKNVLHGDIRFIAIDKSRRSTLSKQINWQGGGMFKYLRLESYEDVLNNLEFRRTEVQQRLLEEASRFRESFMLSYMLDVETQGSPSLLNFQAFEVPFNYKLNISTGSVGETWPMTVDLVETFNYLLGLTVRHIDHIRGFRVVQGTNSRGERVLVIWRNLKEKSNADLEEFFRKQEYNPKDLEFDLIYVNGDNNLENIRREDETWKVRLIEAEFQRLMFEVEDV